MRDAWRIVPDGWYGVPEARRVTPDA